MAHCNVTGFSEETDRAEVVALYVMKGLDCMELSFGNNKVDSFLVRVKRSANKGDIVEEVDYIPPSQDEDTDKLFFEELRETSRSTPSSLWGTSVCWILTGSTTQLIQTGPGDS